MGEFGSRDEVKLGVFLHQAGLGRLRWRAGV